MNYTNRHILEFLEEWAPQSTKLEYDNVGLLIGNEDHEVSKIITCLDVTPDIINEAIESGADLVVAHHPLIFRKLSRITSSDSIGALIYRLIRNDIHLIAAHTNLDAAPGGVSFVLAERLGLRQIQFLKPGGPTDAGIDTGAIYSNGPASGFGAIGELPGIMSTHSFLSLVGDRLGSGGIRYSGSPAQVKNVAVCGGAGSFLAEEAMGKGADAFVTADLKYHDFFTGTDSFLLVDAGHYETEVPINKVLRDRLRGRFPGLDVNATRVNTNPVQYLFTQKPKMK